MKIKYEMNADFLTPISVYLGLQGDQKIILESIPRENDRSRFSILGVDPVRSVKFDHGQLWVDGEMVETRDPLKHLETLVVNPDGDKTLPFTSGAIGYVGFDMLGFYEDIQPSHLEDPIDIPDMFFMLYESFLIFDHRRAVLTLVEDNVYSDRSEEAMAVALKEKIESLSSLSGRELHPQEVKRMTFTSHTAQTDFEKSVCRAKELIRQGDMFQIVLSQRLTADFMVSPFDYYRRLRLENPSSYLYFLDFTDLIIIGSSPERLVAVQDGLVSTNPIAGTRRRGTTVEEDQTLTKELLTDPKEVAEHKMLVDLGRNDIGRIAEYGSVHVPVFMKVEKYRYVMHMTSEVEGRLRPGLTSMDALISTLPAGTLSGAPKIRAYQRIYEFETLKRGVYGGAIGYLTRNDESDFAIAIRTMVVKEGKAHVQAGAGIVYDSIPENEYQETLNKAKSLLEVGE